MRKKLLNFQNFIKKQRFNLALGGIFIAALILRFWVLFKLKNQALKGDEAVFGLMTKHILELKEFPIYLWGAHYAGTLMSYFGAIYFFLFGVSATSSRLVAISFNLVLIILWYKLCEKIYNRNTALIATALIAIPSHYIFSFSALLVEVHLDGLLFTTLIFWQFSEIITAKELSNSRLFFFGLFIGMGIWLTPFIIPAIVSIGIFLILQFPKNLSMKGSIYILLGILTGCTPAIIHNIQHPMASVFRMGSRLLNIERDSLLLGPKGILLLIFKHIIRRITLAFDFIINTPRLILPVFGLENFQSGGKIFKIAGLGVLSIYMSAIMYITSFHDFFKKIKARQLTGLELLVIYLMCFLSFYWFFIDSQRSRYLIPLILPAIVFLAKFITDISQKYGKFSLLILMFILSYNLATFSVYSTPAKDYIYLTKFLEEKKIFYGYSDYWISYPVIFESKEKILISPTIFTEKYDRKEEYTQKVRNAKYAAYIFDAERHTNAEKEFNRKIHTQNIPYERFEVKNFIVYYLKNILPEKLELLTDSKSNIE